PRNSVAPPRPAATPPMITIVSPGTIGITESRNATPKMISRNHQWAEKSASQLVRSVNRLAASEKMLATSAASIPARYGAARPLLASARCVDGRSADRRRGDRRMQSADRGVHAVHEDRLPRHALVGDAVELEADDAVARRPEPRRDLLRIAVVELHDLPELLTALDP